MSPRVAGPTALVVGILALLSVPLGLPGAAAAVVPPPATLPTHPYGTLSNVTYTSSVDRFPLSYEEVLPLHFKHSSTYPLLVYLHGAGSSNAVVRGGSGNGLSGSYLSTTTSAGKTLNALLANASTFGFLVIAPSPRSAQGFYTNSTCLGPEEQDTVDAIHHEESLRHVHDVYLLGDNMGSLAALSIAGHRTGLVQGIALTATITDAFEEFAYKPSPGSSLVAPTCGKWPSATNATSQRTFAYLSVGRFDPKNFSGIRLWVAAGSLDKDAPNNASVWPFEMANYTFLNSTCLVAHAFGEPANCTDPFATLHATSPSAFVYRFFYEPSAGHSVSQLDPLDMFEFFESKVGNGCFETSFPPSTLLTCP